MRPDLTTPAEKGTHAEAMVLAHLAAAGYTVLIPFGVARYDLAVDLGDGDGLKTVQCKLGRLHNGAIHWKSQSSITRFSGSNPGHRAADYRGVVDFFGIWCPGNDGTYLVPPENVGRRCGYLRIDPLAHNATRRDVQWAHDYEVRRLGRDWVAGRNQTSTNAGHSLF